MKKICCIIMATLTVALAHAQVHQSGTGGENDEVKSLTDRVLKIEQHNRMLNVYFNYSAAGATENNSADDKWSSRFYTKSIQLEVKGDLTDKLFYRFRHRLNRSNAAGGTDNFARATDFMMIGYHLSKKFTVRAGKMTQMWGGFEFDLNPMYIYQYSDMGDRMDSHQTGVTLSYFPSPSQEVAVEVSDNFCGSLEEMMPGTTQQGIKKARTPLTYIVNWNGNFADNRFQTRWAVGLQTLAEHKHSRKITLGCKLNLPKLQWYVDYMADFSGLDRMGIASKELKSFLPEGHTYFSDVHYNSWISKVDWRMAKNWNVWAKGMMETASLPHVEGLSTYRHAWGYMGGIEYYPDLTQDFRVSLSYIGRRYAYNKASGLNNFNTNRIELGFMYRIKCF